MEEQKVKLIINESVFNSNKQLKFDPYKNITKINLPRPKTKPSSILNTIIVIGTFLFTLNLFHVISEVDRFNNDRWLTTNQLLSNQQTALENNQVDLQNLYKLNGPESGVIGENTPNNLMVDNNLILGNQKELLKIEKLKLDILNSERPNSSQYKTPAKSTTFTNEIAQPVTEHPLI